MAAITVPGLAGIPGTAVTKAVRAPEMETATLATVVAARAVRQDSPALGAICTDFLRGVYRPYVRLGRAGADVLFS